MKLLIVAIVSALLLQAAYADEDNKGWSWGASEDKPKEEKVEDQQAVAAEKIKRTLTVNATDSEEIVDNILVSNRQGRNLDGYDDLYNDPTVREVLQKGDDNEARNVIRERLCNLGLMQCDDEKSYLSPEDLIYAQPVAINPVGKPIASIPVRNPHRIAGYGPPKPMPHPGGKYGPPHGGPPRRGYGPPPPPQQKPFYNPKPFPTYIPSHPPHPHNGPNFEGPDKYVQPIEPASPYEFENIAQSSFNKKQVIVGGGAGGAAANGVQQHVHHHFHHGAASAEIPAVVVGSAVAAGLTGGQSTLLGGGLANLNGFKESSFSSGGFKESSYGGGLGGGFKESSLLIGDSGYKDLTTATYGGQSIASYGGPNIGLGNYASVANAVKPVHELQGPQTFESSGLYGSNSGTYGSNNGFTATTGTNGGFFGGNTNNYASNNYASNSYGAANNFGTSVGSYGSTQPFYKKELNVNGGQLLGNSLQQSYVDKYQGVESGRAENYDCVCVPFNQCPTQDIIGRKDDLYLAIDPRNKNSDIEAVTDDIRVITDGNGTMTVIRVPKDTTSNVTATEEKPEEAKEEKKVSKREAPEAKALGDNKDKDNVEAVSENEFFRFVVVVKTLLNYYDNAALIKY